jgi:metallo-beta-lactamase family protein
LTGGAVLQLRRAGHILGAAIVEISLEGGVVLFSGDLGRYDDPFMLDPEPAAEPDYVVVESTYGDRTHAQQDAAEALGEIIESTARRGGTVVIPAFAVGRVQVLLYHLWRLRTVGRLLSVPIFLDSPMAIDATELLQRRLTDHRLSREDCKSVCAVATYVRDVDESKAVTASPAPKVVIAGSGMATGGRVLHHIKAYGPQAKNTIVFAGFQPVGTRGAKLLAGADETKIFGEWVPIRAAVADLPMLSAHSDANEILRWLGTSGKPPRRTFIVHGEPAASEALRTRIGRELGWNSAVVDAFRPYELSPA